MTVVIVIIILSLYAMSSHCSQHARSFPQYTHCTTSKINHYHHGGHFNSPAASTSHSQTPPSPRLTPQTSAHKMMTLWSRRTTPSPPLTLFFHCRRRLAASAKQVRECPCNVFQARAHLPICPAALRCYKLSNAGGMR